MSEISGNISTQTQDRALQLLGAGLSVDQVANAVGVTPSRISQLLSDPVYAEQVHKLRFEALNKHNETDKKYDDLENELLERVKETLPLISRPMELLKAVSVINGAKRRGISAPEQLTAQNTVVNLTLPTMLVQKFQVNMHNQVLQAGEQTLQTIQSSSLLQGRDTKPQQLEAVMPDMLQLKESSNERNSPQTLVISSGEKAHS